MEKDARYDTTNHHHATTSLKDKLKQSICSSCCFGIRRSHHEHPPPCPSDDKPTLIWVKTTTHDDEDDVDRPQHSYEHILSEVRDKCRNALGITKHRKCTSADFRYDPLSYALNFEEEGCDFDDDTAPLRNFSARLPPSPAVS